MKANYGLHEVIFKAKLLSYSLLQVIILGMQFFVFISELHSLSFKSNFISIN